MQKTVFTSSRNEMAAFGRELGRALQAEQRDAPWMICLGGDEASGKELIALAIDQALNPARYPDGLTHDLSADRMLGPDYPESRMTVFNNFRRVIPTSQSGFERMLCDFEKANPGAGILIASNIERTASGEFDYSARGLDSDRLDLGIQVHKLPGTFMRAITLTAKAETAGLLKVVRPLYLSENNQKNTPRMDA